MRDDLRDWRKKSLDHLTKAEEEETARQYQRIVGWLKMDEADQLAIFDSIASEASKYPGTCHWILKQSNIMSWLKDKPESPFLWLQGNPGMGKSVIATQIDTFLRSDGKSLVIRHFCTYSYTSSTQYDQILRSILLQIVRSNTDLVAYIDTEYVLGKKSVTVHALEQLILTMRGTISSRYIHLIFDGLDECPEDKQGCIANLLQQMSVAESSTSPVFKVLLSSRSSSFLIKRFRKQPTVSMAAEKKGLEDAINNYAGQKLGLLRQRLFELGLSDGDIQEVAFSIAKKADGKRQNGRNAKLA